MDRWSAIQVIMSTDSFFNRIDAFLNIANTLASGSPFFNVFDPVSVEEAAWAIAEVSLNRELQEFSYPIKQYLKRILRQDGYNPGNWPEIFDEVFEERLDKSDIRSAILNTENKDNVESYIAEQLADLSYQLNEIPHLENIDDILLKKPKEDEDEARD